jgi:uncharacterized YigZ family protein
VPDGEARSDFVIKRSLFIGTAAPADSAEEAIHIVERISQEFKDANHNAWAYRVGFVPHIQTRFHDDGEPGGSAGRPMLAAIQRSGIWNVVVVVTRYFGGIKLGAGGLSRAYGRAAGEALKALRTQERVRYQALRVRVDYSFLETLHRLVSLHEGEIEKETFAVQVEASVLIPVDRLNGFQRALTQASSGSLTAEAGEEIG